MKNDAPTQADTAKGGPAVEATKLDPHSVPFHTPIMVLLASIG